MATVTIGERSYEVTVRGDVVSVDGHDFPIKQQQGQGYTTVTAGGVQYRVALPGEGERVSGMVVEVDHREIQVEWEGSLGGGGSRPQRRAASDSGSAGAAPSTVVKGGIAAQIAGRVVSVKVKEGDGVEAGQVLLLLEAMKMENEIKAPTAGTVQEVRVSDGQRVAEGEVMVVVA